MDINCQFCKQKIKYDDFCEALRASPFNGVVCPHCGSQLDPKYRKVEGTGNKEVVTFTHPLKKTINVVVNCSCKKCGTFFVNGSKVCPFCDATLGGNGVDHRSVAGVGAVHPFMKLMLKIQNLKTEVANHELKQALAYKDVGNGKNLQRSVGRAEKIYSHHSDAIKFISLNISKLEMKLKNGC